MQVRSLKIFILVIVFGVPVVWYLFLQLFGENKFELEVLMPFEFPCAQNSTRLYLKQLDYTVEEQNQVNRLVESMMKRNLDVYRDSSNCLDDPKLMPILLVDDDSNLRGMYDLTIEEVDRAIVEVDLLLTLQYGTSTKQ